jgi:hypothetical protein
MGSLEASIKTARPLRLFHKGDLIKGSNAMASYSYTLDEAPGTEFAEGFTPYKTPGEMLALGIFGGKYLNDCTGEFPKEWFATAFAKEKLSPEKTDISINFFAIDSRLPLSEWRKAGWVPSRGGRRVTVRRKKYALLADPKKNPDERGWFQWYCRYWMGRRIPELDKVQIGRWKAFTRHAGAIKKNCTPGDLTCRPKQRQALLHWAYNPFI